MASLQSLIQRVRRELGDWGHPFRDTFFGTGDQVEYDLSGTNISTTSTFAVQWIHDGVATDLIQGDTQDYAVEVEEGVIHLLSDRVKPLQDGDILNVQGTSSGMFSDQELAQYVMDAFRQHTHDASASTRYRDQNGFIKYDTEPIQLYDLPEIEELPVAILATVEALWAIATDASTDINVSTADGTSVDRSQRYSQVRQQIDALTEKYQWLCQQLNVGLNRIEMFTLRRVSRTTNRLIPIFVEREYDDYEYPNRILPSIDKRDEDHSGILSPSFGAGWW